MAFAGKGVGGQNQDSIHSPLICTGWEIDAWHRLPPRPSVSLHAAIYKASSGEQAGTLHHITSPMWVRRIGSDLALDLQWFGAGGKEKNRKGELKYDTCSWHIVYFVIRNRERLV